MSDPQAGWYPDPSGNAGKLRFWDGSQWTNDFMYVRPDAQGTDSAESAGGGRSTSGGQTPEGGDGPRKAGEAGTDPMAEGIGTGGSAGSAAGHDAGDAGATPTPTRAVYQVSSQDQTLRLIAFIFNLLSTIAVAVFVIPLAWMIPMTVRSYNIYRGTRPNTVAFGVCTLIFVSRIAGILLLVSKKDR